MRYLLETNLRRRGNILGIPIDAVGWDEALARIVGWAQHKESRVVCFCNVHSIVTAQQDPSFGHVLRNADMAAPDGMPLAIMLRRQGFAGQPRINGPDLMWKLVAKAEQERLPVFFFGSIDTTLATLKVKLLDCFPKLIIAGSIAPPFRPLSTKEDSDFVKAINESGARLLLVGLGCPKQEQWMFEHQGVIRAVMLGLGAAFNFHAGVTRRAPRWMCESGFEWLYRLGMEPRRLWKRYLITNTLFIIGAARELCSRARE